MGLVLVALAAAVVLLYFWLLGHWFARVLTFVVLAIPLAFLGTCYAHDPVTALFGMVVGGTAAWFIAGIPPYYWRWRIKQIAEAERAEDARLTKEAMQRFNAQHGLVG